MLIKVMRSSSSQRHRVCDVARHVRYLLAGRGPGINQAFMERLAGPPFARNLVQRHSPFEGDLFTAATDVASQLVQCVLLGSAGQDRPHHLYRHVVISLAPRYRQRTALCPSEDLMSRSEGTFSGILRIALDTFNLMGVDERLPLYLVAHADRRHMHAHALIGVRALGAKPLPDFLNRAALKRVAMTMCVRYGLAANSAALHDSHTRAASWADVYELRSSDRV